MSKAYGYGLLNAKYNTLQQLVLSNQGGGGGVTPDLQDVLDQGDSANDVGITLINTTNNKLSTLTSEQLQMAPSTGLNTYPLGLLTNEKVELAGTAGGTYARLTAQSDIPYLDLTTPTNSVDLYSNGLSINSNFGTSGQVLTRTATGNEFGWVNPPSSTWVGTAASNLNMAGFDITTSAGVPLDITATNINLQGQTDFNLPPTAPSPTLGDQVATKGYVDSLVGQYAGGYNLFLNYSQVAPLFPAFKVLTGEISTSLGTNTTNTITNGTQDVATFITEPLGLTEVPIGLWDLFIYGTVSGIGGDVHYTFQLWKEDILGNATPLGTSGISADVNAIAGNPTVYSCVLAITTTQVLDLTDRLFIIVKVQKTGVNTVDVVTYFEGNYYSFIQTSLNAGTTLLGSDNTWTGNNAFELDITTPAISSTTGNLDVGSSGSVTTLKGDVTIESNLFLGTPNSIQLYGGAEDDRYDTTTQNDIGIRTGNNRNEVYNAIISASTAGVGALVLPTVTTGYYVNVYNNSIFNWTISSQTGEQISQGPAGSATVSPSAITIRPNQSMSFYQNNGGVGNKTNFMCGEVINGTQGQFTSLLSTSLDAAAPTTLSIGNSVATTTTIGRGGVGVVTNINGTITNITGATINITGAAAVNGAGSLNVPTQATNTNNTVVASTGWVNNFFGAKNGQVWTGTQNFTGAVLTAISQLTNTNSTLVATTAWVNSFFGALAGSVWSGTQNFTGATLTALTQATNTNTTVVATTQWVNSYFGALAGSVWSGTQNFTGATLTALTQLTNTDNTLVATTQWVNNFFGELAGATWSGNQNFTGAALTAQTQLTNTDDTLVATTAWTNNFFGELAGATWSGNQNFTGSLLTALTQAANTNDTIVATTAWVNNFFGLKAGQTWTGTHSFTGATLNAFTNLTNVNNNEVATTAWTNTFYAPKAAASFTGGVTIQGGLRGSGTTLSIIQPVIPSSITYSSTTGTGTISTSAVGAVVISSGGAAVTIASGGTNLNNCLVSATGVYMVSGVLKVRNDDVAGTIDRLVLNLGYGATGSTNSNLIQIVFGKIQFGATAALGFQNDFPYSYIYTVDTLGAPNNFITAAAFNNGTNNFPISSVGSRMVITRIA
jgi:hypothetical protein